MNIAVSALASRFPAIRSDISVQSPPIPSSAPSPHAGGLARRYAPSLYEHMFLDQVAVFGGFAVWRRIAFLETYGVHGIAALGFALLLFRWQ